MPFPMNISPKVNAIAQPELELTNNYLAVHHVIQYAHIYGKIQLVKHSAEQV